MSDISSICQNISNGAIVLSLGMLVDITSIVTQANQSNGCRDIMLSSVKNGGHSIQFIL